MLYELLCRRLPFRSKKRRELLEEIRHRHPDAPRTIDDDIPEPLERVCLKALNKDPAKRYQTAGDMARALRAAIEPRPTPLQRIAGLLPAAGVLLSLAALIASDVL